MRLNKCGTKGFSLIEALVASAIFVILALGIYQAFISVQASIKLSRRLVNATALASNQMEVIRNLPYADIKSQTATTTTAEGSFSVVTTVQPVDDAYKLVSVQVDPVTLYTYIAP